MRKLTLELEALTVESFAADGAAEARGTVAARQFTVYADECVTPNGTCERDCSDHLSCWGTCNSCAGTCGATCGGWTCGATCAGCTGETDCGCQTWETCPAATVCA